MGAISGGNDTGNIEQSIRQGIENALKNPLVYGFLKTSGYLDLVVKYMPEIIQIILDNERGREILGELTNGRNKHRE